MHELTPSRIVGELDTYIIGQHEAKRSVAVALRNRWRRLNAPEEMREEIMPNNIILIGPTGVGKTEIARRLAKLSGAPFIKVEATKFTEVGYVGRDVDSIVRDLVDIAVGLVREEHTEKVQERARINAEERILDILIPPAQTTPATMPFGITLPAVDAPPDTDADLRERTRNKFRDRLRAGELDTREIELELAMGQGPGIQMFGPLSGDDIGINLQEIMEKFSPSKRKKRRLSVAEAREHLVAEEAGKLIDMEKVSREAIERVEQSGIVFIDEIDKVASRNGKGSGPDVSREGVQRDLLPLVEGSRVMTKYGAVKTDHVLFIASGAFHVSKPSDLIPEFQGRFPIRVELKSLTEEDFVQILTQPRNALLKQYKALLASEGVDVTFTDDCVREIARYAAEVNAEVENIGARRLHTILTTLLEDILYDVPDRTEERTLTIDGARVRERLSGVVQNRDLTRFIL